MIFKMSDILPLNHILYNNKSIFVTSISAFITSSKEKNDENNIMRENIIGAIINQKIPPLFYDESNEWTNMKESIKKYTNELVNHRPYTTIECIHKAGRKNNHDFVFDIHFEDETKESFPIELKFNASSIEKTPQYVSPMKPSQYLYNNGVGEALQKNDESRCCSYEDYYYDYYLTKLSILFELPLPQKDIWLKEIHSNTPECMKEYKKKYDQGCKKNSNFTNNEKDILCYETAKKQAKESIVNFIKMSELNIELLSEYLQKTQQNKIYMLYFQGEFKLQHINMDDYFIESVVKNPLLNRYDCMTKSGKKMKVLLRWKNGNGIAFPAFQIS